MSARYASTSLGNNTRIAPRSHHREYAGEPGGLVADNFDFCQVQKLLLPLSDLNESASATDMNGRRRSGNARLIQILPRTEGRVAHTQVVILKPRGAAVRAI